MSTFDEWMKKYLDRGYEVIQKRTLRYGVRFFLGKEREKAFKIISRGLYGIYVYYVEGDANTNHILEFLKDYARFYEETKFDERDKGFFVVSGDLDDLVFRRLKNDYVGSQEMFNSIHVERISAGPPRRKEVVKSRAKTGALSRDLKIAVGGGVNFTCPNCGSIFPYALPSTVLKRKEPYHAPITCPRCRSKYTLFIEPNKQGTLTWQLGER